MKILIIYFVLIIPTILFAQEPQTINEKDSIKIEKDIENMAMKFKEKLEQANNYTSDADKKLVIAFTIDTFKIETRMSKEMKIDNSTVRMSDASYKGVAEYDKLLNKYYKLLIERLEITDKESLRKSQKIG